MNINIHNDSPSLLHGASLKVASIVDEHINISEEPLGSANAFIDFLLGAGNIESQGMNIATFQMLNSFQITCSSNDTVSPFRELESECFTEAG